MLQAGAPWAQGWPNLYVFFDVLFTRTYPYDLYVPLDTLVVSFPSGLHLAFRKWH